MQAAVDKIDADTAARVADAVQHGEHRKRMLELGLRNWRTYLDDTWHKSREHRAPFTATLTCDSPDKNITRPWRDRNPDVAIAIDEFVEAKGRDGFKFNITVKESKWEPVERYWERGEKITVSLN